MSVRRLRLLSQQGYPDCHILSLCGTRRHVRTLRHNGDLFGRKRESPYVARHILSLEGRILLYAAGSPCATRNQFQPKPHIVRKESYTVGCNAYINWDCLQGGGENYSETDCYKISAEEVDAFLNDMDRKIAEGKYKLKNPSITNKSGIS